MIVPAPAYVGRSFAPRFADVVRVLRSAREIALLTLSFERFSAAPARPVLLGRPLKIHFSIPSYHFLSNLKARLHPYYKQRYQKPDPIDGWSERER